MFLGVFLFYTNDNGVIIRAQQLLKMTHLCDVSSIKSDRNKKTLSEKYDFIELRLKCTQSVYRAAINDNNTACPMVLHVSLRLKSYLESYQMKVIPVFSLMIGKKCGNKICTEENFAQIVLPYSTILGSCALSILRSLCEVAGDCFGPRYFSSLPKKYIEMV